MRTSRSCGTRFGASVVAAALLGALLPVLSVAASAMPSAGAAAASAAAVGSDVTIYTGAGIVSPKDIAVGPDGALWFTNGSGPNFDSIGRITTGGSVTHYTGAGINDPGGIAVGSDGALWFTNQGNGSIGRITTAGTVTNYTGAEHQRPGGDRGGARRGAVVHERLSAPTRSGGSRPPGRSRTTPTRASAARSGSRSGPTGPCGSPTTATTRSGGSPPPGRSPTTPTRASAPVGDHGRARRGPVVHQPRNNSIGRITTAGTVTNYTDPSISDPVGIAVGPDGALWFTN